MKINRPEMDRTDTKAVATIRLLAFFRGQGLGDRLFRLGTAGFAFLILLLAGMVVWQLGVSSRLSFHAFGWTFLVSSDWDPVQQIFGALPYIYGTLCSSFIALLLAVPLGLGVALTLSELSPRKLQEPLSVLVEILATIPSVVYGLWGLFVLAPFFRVHVDPLLIRTLGAPLFAPPSMGLSLLTASVVLAIMILPTIISISREVFETIPNSQRESVLALGATRWETIRMAVLRPSGVGLLGAVMLALGRALGETMAVAMVIGNRPQVTANLLAPGHSMASVIANEFTEAVGDLYISSLVEIGFLLLIVTLILNMGATLLIWTTSRKFQTATRRTA